jgi:two-component system chemotaxis response regulator CheY
MTIKFLIVDRNSSMRSIIRAQLKDMGFSNIQEAGNAESALLNMTRHEYDVILTEVDLPGIDGFQFIEEIKKKHIINDFQIMVIASALSKAELVRLAQMGVTSFLIKPFTLVAFEQHLKSLLS